MEQAKERPSPKVQSLNLPEELASLYERAVALLEAKRISATPHRALLLALLLRKGYHPTAEELEEDANQYLSVGTTTVYLALKMFLTVQLVHSLVDTAGKVRYGGYLEPHVHLHCLICKTTTDVEVSTEAPLVQEPLAEGWKLQTSYPPMVILYGLCPICGSVTHLEPA
ncbi:Transcriptional regulator PerR [bacterium HR39]|nr:Transcriptional regulator PerR [bacterium HR39]